MIQFLVCTVIFLIVLFFMLEITGGTGHIKYASSVSKVEGLYKFPLIYLQSHMFTKHERMYMNAFDSESKYNAEFLSRVEASISANLSGMKTRHGQDFIRFPEDEGKVIFEACPLHGGFMITPSLVSVRVDNKQYVFPPRIIFLLRKVKKMNGIIKTQKNHFDKRK